MSEMYEPSNPLSMPFECFVYGSSTSPFPIHAHWHYFAQLLLAREGNILVTGGNTEYVLHPGEAFFVYPSMVHSIDTANGEPVIYDVIKLDINQFDDSPAYAPQMRTVIEDVARRRVSPFFTAEEVEKMGLSEKISACIHEYNNRVYGYDLVIRSQLYLVLTELLRQWMKNGFTLQEQMLRSELFGSVQSITSYIESHLRENLKVEELARYCRMSYPSFARKFRELYGISCKEYIEQVRIARVEHFLQFTGCDLTYISQETGYADCSHMIRDFKRLRNTTPAKYRADHKSL